MPLNTVRTICDRKLVSPAAGSIGREGERVQGREELVALAAEQSRVGQPGGGGHGAGVGRGRRTNYRAERQIRTNELARRGHDLVGISRAGDVNPVWGLGGGDGKLRKQRASSGRNRRRVPRFVLPKLEVLDFCPADAGHDSDDFETRRLRENRVVKTRATLLDRREVEAGGIRNKLDVIPANGKVTVRNARQVYHGDDLREGIAEIGGTWEAVAIEPTW